MTREFFGGALKWKKQCKKYDIPFWLL